MRIRHWLQSRLRYEDAERIRSLICALVYYSGLGWVISLINRPGTSILVYHSIEGRGVFSDNVIPAAAFERHMRFISRHRKPVALSAIVDAVVQGREPDPKWIAVSFDDGYLDFVTTALPIMERYGVPSTLFVPTVILQGETLFFDELEACLRNTRTPEIEVSLDTGLLKFKCRNRGDVRDAALRLALRIRGLPPVLRVHAMQLVRETCGSAGAVVSASYVQVEDLERLPPSVEIGAHTVNHYSLPRLDDETLGNELAEPRATLGAVRGGSARYLAYPFGKAWAFNERIVASVADHGYTAAVTTVPGQVRADTNRYSLPRIAGCVSLAALKMALMGVEI